MSAGAAGAAAAAAALANASASFGPCLRVEPAEFLRVLAQQDAPLVAGCESTGWFGGTRYRYLTSYKGLTFYAKSDVPIDLPRGVELVTVRKMNVPYL